MSRIKYQSAFAIPKEDFNKEVWLRNFAEKLPLFSTRYDIAEEDLVDMENSARYFTYWHNVQNNAEKLLLNVMAFKTEACFGTLDYLIPAREAPDLRINNGKTPKDVLPGIFVRVDKLLSKIISHREYNTNDGYYLGMSELQPLDATSKIKPYILINISANGQPRIKWERMQTDALELSVNRGDGYQFMGKVSSGLVTDNAMLPENKTIWKYKGIFRKFDKQVGIWSDEMIITVQKQPG